MTKTRWILLGVLILIWWTSRYSVPATTQTDDDREREIAAYRCHELRGKALSSMSADDLVQVRRCQIGGLW